MRPIHLGCIGMILLLDGRVKKVLHPARIFPNAQNYLCLLRALTVEAQMNSSKAHRYRDMNLLTEHKSNS